MELREPNLGCVSLQAGYRVQGSTAELARNEYACGCTYVLVSYRLLPDAGQGQLPVARPQRERPPMRPPLLRTVFQCRRSALLPEEPR
jgi:hypothetical protein